MSFSPDIDQLGFRHANIFAWDNYTATKPPYPDYLVATVGADYGSLADAMLEAGEGDIKILNFTKEPLYFPTLEVGGVASFVYAAPFTSIDYLVHYNSAVLNNTPKIDNSTSGFFDWDSGFGFGISNAVHAYNHPTGPGAVSRFIDIVPMSQLDTAGHETLNVFGYNCEDAIEYIKSNINNSPYMTVCVTREIAADASMTDKLSSVTTSVTRRATLGERLEDDIAGTIYDVVDDADYFLEGYGGDLQQVLFKTNVVLMSPTDRIVYKPDASFAGPENELPVTDPKLVMTAYPKVSEVVPTNDGSFRGDLKLFEAPDFIHKYDSDYSYVRDDIRSRFKPSNMVIEQRNAYISEKVDKFFSELSVTFDVPKGLRARRHASPKIVRGNYTTFDYDDTIAITNEGPSMSDTSSASTAASVSSAGMSGGGGGSY